MRQDNVRIRIPTWFPDHADPSAIIGKSAYRKRDSRLSHNVNQTAHARLGVQCVYKMLSLSCYIDVRYRIVKVNSANLNYRKGIAVADHRIGE